MGAGSNPIYEHIYEGSAKKVGILPGGQQADFDFSDRYSVFDWGEMPDLIRYKGPSLAAMSAKTFELCNEIGIGTHYIGMVELNDNTIVGNLSDMSGISKVMRVNAANIIRPDGLDYSFFEDNRGEIDNYLIPDECIYRNGYPEGSSVLRKFNKLYAKREAGIKAKKEYDAGLITQEQFEERRMTQEQFETNLSALLENYDLPTRPTPNYWREQPIYDFSTKLEESGDRALSDEEAFEISGLTVEGFEELKRIMKGANNVITEQCNKVGFVNWDGKFEFIKYNGRTLIADVAGTLDECRFTIDKIYMRDFVDNHAGDTDYIREAVQRVAENGEDIDDLLGRIEGIEFEDNVQVSKEVIRQYYRKTQPGWLKNIEKYKNIAKANLKSGEGRTDWRNMMEEEALNHKDTSDYLPKQMSSKLVGLVSEMYMASANRYSETEVFPGMRSVEEIMFDIQIKLSII